MTNRDRHIFVALVIAVVGVSAATGVLAQLRATQTQTVGTGLILGQVVDANTGRGIPSVLVVLGPAAAATPVGELTEARPPSMPPSIAGARRTLTAADGRFLFRDLPKGRFTVSASAPAYG